MISGTQTTQSYTSDGVSTNWAVPFPFFAFTDLVVQQIVSGIATTLAYGTAWTGSGTPDAYGAYENGGSVVFNSGFVPPASATILITRVTARTQLNTFLDNNPFPAIVVERALDTLTLMMQEVLGPAFLGVLAGPPSSGVAGQWFILTPFVAGGSFGMCCTVTGTPGTWNPFGLISL